MATGPQTKVSVITRQRLAASGTRPTASQVSHPASGQTPQRVTPSPSDHSTLAREQVATHGRTDSLFELGNGIASRSWQEPAASNRSNAITTLKNGQTSLINKAWKSATDAAPNDPEVPLADYGATSSGGNALVVDGHAVLNGKVVISVPQGDISMGNYQINAN